MFSHIQRWRLRALVPTKPERIHAQRLRRLRVLVARQAPTEWGRSYIEDHLALDPDTTDARCPRFAGIVEESGDQAIVLADSEFTLAGQMAGMLMNDIPIRPIELVDLDTEQRHLAICDVTVSFLPAEGYKPASSAAVA